MEKMTVKQVCELTGVTPRLLQIYDEKGLLCPARSGEGVANNQKLYTFDDLDRLKKILVLKKYGLQLRQIRQIIDSDDDELLVVLSEQLVALRREQTRLKNLIVFAHFARIVDDDMFEALINGAVEIDDFAELMMETAEFDAACEASRAVSEEEGQERIEGLIRMMLDFVAPAHEQSFADWESFVEQLRLWWGRHCPPLDQCGLLGNWLIFTCYDEVAAIAEKVGGEETPGFMQAAIFLVWAKQMLLSFAGPARKLRAAQRKGDEKAEASVSASLLDAFSAATGADRLREVLDAESYKAYVADLCEGLLGYLDGLLGSPVLREYVDPEGKIRLSQESLSLVEEAIKSALREADGAAD